MVILLTVLAAFAVYLVGNGSVPLWDRDEPRYAQCSRQMLQSGDWVVPRLYDKVRTAKPPFIYWCQAAAMRVLGDTAFAARLPSAIAMAVTLLLVGFVVRRQIGPEHAFWTVLILGTSVLTLVAAKASMTDSVLLLWITIAQCCLFAMLRGNTRWWIVVLWAIAVGLAGLTKGPVVLGVQAMTGVMSAILSWSARRRAHSVDGGFGGQLTSIPHAERLRAGKANAHKKIELAADDAAPHPNPHPLPQGQRSVDRSDLVFGNGNAFRYAMGLGKILLGLFVLTAVVLPWMILVERRYPGFLSTAINHEVGKRSLEGLEGHSGPPGYYLVMIWPMFLPWSLILPLAMVSGWNRRNEPTVRFALAAVLGPWLMFEIVQTKLPHYLLPCFPALAFLAADGLVACFRGRLGALADRAFLGASIAWAAVLALLGIAPWVAVRWFRPLPWAAMGVVSIAVIVYGATVVTLLYRRRAEFSMRFMGAGMIVLALILFGVYLPRVEFLQIATRTAAALREDGATAPGQSVMLDYKEPSLAFYQGGTIREDRGTVITQKLLDAAPPWLVVTGEVWDSADPAVRSRLKIIRRVRGLDLADGVRVVDVLAVRQTAESQASGR